MPLIIPGNSQASTGYVIDQSIRFDDAAEHFMYSPTPSSSKDFSTTCTISLWFKIANITQGYLAGAFYGSNSRYNLLQINASGQLQENDRVGGASTATGSGGTAWTTTRVFRDPSAWYHAVMVWDTTNAVQSERFKLYINGVRETDFATNPALGASELVYWFGKSSYTTLGAYFNGTGYADLFYFDGYLAEMHGVDGTALDQNSFGEFNSSGIWIPKEYEGSHGTDGFYIKGADSSALGTNSAANGNNFTLNAISSHDQVLDSPTNNFATYNVLNNYIGGHTFSEGNLKRVKNASKRIATLVTQGASSGKWYCECYSVTVSQLMLGIQAYEPDAEPEWPGNGVTDQGYGYYSSNGQRYINGSGASYGSSWTNGDIIGIAMDLDNNKLYFSKNGTFQDSGDPTSGSTGTGAISITDPASTELGLYFFAFGDGSGSSAQTNVINCGQDGTFAGNTTAGGNSDSNGIGNFKYSVPSGYLALCTKNLGS